MPIIVLMVIALFVVSTILSAPKSSSQQSNSSPDDLPRSPFEPQKNGKYTGRTTSEQRARLEQLRKLQQQRQAQAAAAAGRADKAEGKPIYPHQTEECTGGSIHDGYHEGSVLRPAPASSAEGRLGKQGVMASEGLGPAQLGNNASAANAVKPKQSAQAFVGAKAAAEPSGVEKLSKAISDKPAIVQGLIWSEVLGRPLSDS